MGSSTQGTVTDFFIILLWGISLPSHCQHNNDLNLPALMTAKPILGHGTNRGKAVGVHKKTSFEVCNKGLLFCSLVIVSEGVGSDHFYPLSAASRLSSCFTWKDQGRELGWPEGCALVSALDHDQRTESEEKTQEPDNQNNNTNADKNRLHEGLDFQ